MTDLVVPFNHQPDSVAVKTGSYTIPTGQYARITVSLTAQAYGTISDVGIAQGTDPAEIHYTSDIDSKTATFFVPTGTQCGVTSSAASATQVLAAADNNEPKTVEDKSSATFTIGGVTAISCEANASCTARLDGITSTTMSIKGDVDARYIVELYNELT